MNRYGVTVAMAASIAAGMVLGTAAGDAFGGVQGRKRRPPRNVAARKQAPPKAVPRLRIGDGRGALLRIGDERVRRTRSMVTPWDMPGMGCTWVTMARNADPGVYDDLDDKATLYWQLNCGDGDGDGCQWSYWVYIASGAWSLYNPPDQWLASRCANGSLFSCGSSDNNWGVYLKGVGATYGTGTYTMYVFIYPNTCDWGGSPYAGDCFTFTVR